MTFQQNFYTHITLVTSSRVKLHKPPLYQTIVFFSLFCKCSHLSRVEVKQNKWGFFYDVAFVLSDFHFLFIARAVTYRKENDETLRVFFFLFKWPPLNFCFVLRRNQNLVFSRGKYVWSRLCAAPVSHPANRNFFALVCCFFSHCCCIDIGDNKLDTFIVWQVFCVWRFY